MSVEVYHGMPGCGKSTRMKEAAFAVAERTGLPIIVADPGRVEQWAPFPHAETVEQVIRAAWGGGRHVAWSGSDPDELEAICRAALAARDVVLVVDELRPYAYSQSVGSDLVILARQHRHARVELFLGTQSIQDIRTDLLAAASRIWTGRYEIPKLLHFVASEWGYDPARVASLGWGEFIEKKMGFTHGKVPSHPPAPPVDPHPGPPPAPARPGA